MVKKKVSFGKLEINFTNRSLYTLIAFFIIASLGVGVYALGTTPNPGHSIAQLQTCSDGQILKMSGASWSCGADEEGSGGTSLWTQSGSDISYSSGNVGIGTTDLTAELTVAGDIHPTVDNAFVIGTFGKTYNKLRLSKNYGGIDWYDSFGDLAGVIYMPNNNNLVFSDFESVGIGTTIPVGKLEVSGAGGIALHGGDSEFIMSNRDQAFIYQSSAGVGAYYPFDIAGHLILQPRGDNTEGESGDIVFATSDSLTPQVSMVITSGGKVGIGTTEPTHKLEVANSMIVKGKVSIPYIILTNNIESGQPAIIGGSGNTGGGLTRKFHIVSTGEMVFEVNDYTGRLEAMYIDTSGNVKISNTMRLTPRSTAPTCDSNTVGTIYYSSSSKNFLGCKHNYPTYGAYGYAPLS